MKKILKSQFIETHNEEVNLLKPKLVDYLKTNNTYINSIIHEAFMSYGKFLRPRLFFSSSKLFSYNGPSIYELAAVCEFIHCASLLHDDVIDESKMRRNKTTINALCDNKTAILLGDLIYSSACRLMVKSQSLEVIDCFAECIRSMSESELFQSNLIWNPKTTIQNYFSVIKGKTSNLFSASLCAPAILTHSNSKTVKMMREYGEYLGYIFQITDDCLDFSGDIVSIGKQTHHDIHEGKLTLPILIALNERDKLDSKFGKIMDKLFHTKSVSDDEIDFIVGIIHDNGFLKKAKNIASQYANKCTEILQKTEWQRLNQKNLQPFFEIPFELIERLN